jgi:hypothetical protein
MKILKKPWTWMDSLHKPKRKKMDMRFGTWNVRSSLRAVVEEISKYVTFCGSTGGQMGRSWH